jgi:hypothetical protein
MGRRRSALGLALALAAAPLASCFTVGREFPVEPVGEIRLGVTTRADVERTFGRPWRTGLEDGDPTWTYARYRYGLFGATRTTDLVIRFDERGRVVSYTFNTTDPARSAN